MCVCARTNIFVGGVKEIAHQLTALAILAESLSLVLSTNAK